MNQTIVSIDSLRARRQDAALPSLRATEPTAAGFADTRLVIWGTGACARDFVTHLRPEVEVVAHVDSDARKWGSTFAGCPVIAPAALRSLPRFDKIVIASQFVTAIRNSLSTLALPRAIEILSWGGRFDGWRCQELFAHPLMYTLQVGITTRCNLMCRHCPRDTDDSVYADVDLDTFRKYLEAFEADRFHSLLVSDFGEVTMLKNFLAYLRTARSHGWKNIEFVTNATNGRRALWEAVFKEDLARQIVISLEGTGAAFESVREFSWKKFAANVATITELNRKHGRRAFIVFNAVCMRSNLHDLPDVVDFAALHGADLTLVHLNPSNQFNNPLGDADNHLDRAPRAEVLEVFREIKRRAARLGVQTLLPEDFPELQDAPAHRVPIEQEIRLTDGYKASTSDLICTQPLRWVEVDGQGNVYPCCQMAKRHSVGSLETNTFEEIWAGPEFRRLLDGLRPGGTPIDVCRECNMYHGKTF